MFDKGAGCQNRRAGTDGPTSAMLSSLAIPPRREGEETDERNQIRQLPRFPKSSLATEEPFAISEADWANRPFIFAHLPWPDSSRDSL